MKIPLSRLIPHPQVCSHFTSPLKEKLKAHIEQTNLYPPLVVRSLSKSKAFYGTNGKLQIIDGHLRYAILKELGARSASVVNFGPLTDEQTTLLLLTLNPLRAHENPQKRARLIADYAKDQKLTLDELQTRLPDTKRSLERLLRLADDKPKIRKAAKPENAPKPFAIYLDPDQHELVRKATAAARKQFNLKNLADALETLARNFLDNSKQTPTDGLEISADPTELSARNRNR